MWQNLWFNEERSVRLRALLASRSWVLDHDLNRIVPAALTKDVNHPWIFVNDSCNRRNCLLWREVMFDAFNLIPSFCRFYCHKVVISMNAVSDLIRLYQVMHGIPLMYNLLEPLPGKCGIDFRDYTGSPYAGICYANSMEEGQYYFEIMREAVDTYLSSDVEVSLKKSCTEMEGKIPTDDPFWQEMTSEEQSLEIYLEEIFLVDSGIPFQPTWVKNHIIYNWLKRAHGIGDKTGEPFKEQFKYGVHAVTYHKNAMKKPKTRKHKQKE